MTDTIIISGGNIQSDFALDFLRKTIKQSGKTKIRLIAADKGLEFFIKNNILPDIAIGDFDSLSDGGKDYLGGQSAMEVIRLKPEKDDSDTQSAVNLAITRGAENIVILGATGTRTDHFMANLGLLVLGYQSGVSVSLVDSHNYVTLIKSGTILKKEEQFGRYVSFFPLGGTVSGLTLRGFKYPLKMHDLTVADSGLTVSNEIQEPCAEVTFDSGILMMVMSAD